MAEGTPWAVARDYRRIGARRPAARAGSASRRPAARARRAACLDERRARLRCDRRCLAGLDTGSPGRAAPRSSPSRSSGSRCSRHGRMRPTPPPGALRSENLSHGCLRRGDRLRPAAADIELCRLLCGARTGARAGRSAIDAAVAATRFFRAGNMSHPAAGAVKPDDLRSRPVLQFRYRADRRTRCAMLAFRLLPPMTPTARTRRLLALTLRDLRRLSRGQLWVATEWEQRVYGRISALPSSVDTLQAARMAGAFSLGRELFVFANSQADLHLAPSWNERSSPSAPETARQRFGSSTTSTGRLRRSRPKARLESPIARSRDDPIRGPYPQAACELFRG